MNNNINAYNVSNNVLPLWNEIRNLGHKDKIELITLLSVSLSDDVRKGEQHNKSQEFIARCGGAWKGDMTAEQIINEINNKKSSTDPVKF